MVDQFRQPCQLSQTLVSLNCAIAMAEYEGDLSNDRAKRMLSRATTACDMAMEQERKRRRCNQPQAQRARVALGLWSPLGHGRTYKLALSFVLHLVLEEQRQIRQWYCSDMRQYAQSHVLLLCYKPMPAMWRFLRKKRHIARPPGRDTILGAPPGRATWARHMVVPHGRATWAAQVARRVFRHLALSVS